MIEDVTEAVSSLSSWSQLSVEDIVESAAALNDVVGSNFNFIEARKCNTGMNIATFSHAKSGLEFNLIPGDDASLGFSDSEFQIAQQMAEADVDVLQRLRPATTIKVHPFLISRFPLLEKIVEDVIEVDWSIFRPDFQPLSGEETGDVPIYLTRSEVKAVISHFGLTLPTEAQWEYAVRGGTDTPFYFGSNLPEKAILAAIMNTDYSNVDDSGSLAANPFGIFGMLVGGWCQDSWAQERWTGIDAGPPHVVRGGAAIYWPWQGAGEWMLALSAMRRSAEELEDETCSAHIAYTLDA